MEYISAREYLKRIKESEDVFILVDMKYKMNAKFLILALVVNNNVIKYYDEFINSVMNGEIESTKDAGVDAMYDSYIKEKEWRYQHLVIDGENKSVNLESDLFLTTMETEEELMEEINYYEEIKNEADRRIEDCKSKIYSKKLVPKK